MGFGVGETLWPHLNLSLADIWSWAQRFLLLTSIPGVETEGHTFSSPSCLGLLFDWGLECWTLGGQGNVLSMLSCSFSQEEKSLVSGCDGVSSCSFLSDSALFLTAFDGLLELWDLKQGCR